MKGIVSNGTVQVNADGSVHVEGFDIDFSLDYSGKDALGFSGCQSAYNMAVVWAIQRLAFSLTEEGFNVGSID